MTTEQDMFDLAAASQDGVRTNLMQKRLSRTTKRLVPSENLVIMGGCALNCSANSNITGRFKNVWIMPNPGDAGSCIGASQMFFNRTN